MDKQEIDYELRNHLFEQHITPHLGYVYKICISRARAPNDMPELVNEVLIKLLKGIKTYNPSLPILPWIATVARRHIGEMYSRRGLLLNDYVDIETIPSNELFYDWDFCDNMDEWLSPSMTAAVEMLKPAQRMATMLKVQSHTIAEIAEILHSNKLIRTQNDNTARSVLFNARSKLSKLIDRDGKLLVPFPHKPRRPLPAKLLLTNNEITKRQTFKTMAKLKSELDTSISLNEKEYFDLIECKLLIEALKAAGIEELPIYRAANTILQNARIEIHLKPIQRNYR